jgi:hypothetical protein
MEIWHETPLTRGRGCGGELAVELELHPAVKIDRLRIRRTKRSHRLRARIENEGDRFP